MTENTYTHAVLQADAYRRPVLAQASSYELPRRTSPAPTRWISHGRVHRNNGRRDPL